MAWRRQTRPLFVAVGAAGVAARLALVDPAEPGHYPGCPILAVTGMYCPGCGGLRALHDLTHGDLVAALSSNLVVTSAVPMLFVLWICWVRRIAAAGSSTVSAQRLPSRAAAGASRAVSVPGPVGDPMPLLPGQIPDPPRFGPNGPLRGSSRTWIPIVSALGLILFAVLRNLPGFEVLAP